MDDELVEILEYVRKSELLCIETIEAIKKDTTDGSDLSELPEVFAEFAAEVSKTFGRLDTTLTDLFERIESDE